VVVDPGEAEVLERAVAQKLKEPDLRSLRCKRTGLHLLEDGPELRPRHCGKFLRRVDFQLGWSIECSIGSSDSFIFL
jgi:hypothetical protein